MSPWFLYSKYANLGTCKLGSFGLGEYLPCDQKVTYLSILDLNWGQNKFIKKGFIESCNILKQLVNN